MLLRSIVTSLMATLGLLLAPPPVAAQLRGTLVASGFTRPLGFVQDPSNPAVHYVLEQGGRIRVLVNGALSGADFLDLSTQIASVGEQGLLGLAFAPDYATSGRVFVSFTNPAGHSVVARFRRSTSDPLRLDPATRVDLVWPGGQAFITQPFGNHNGGHLAFGPDGYLYFSPGDGGSGNDPNHYAQDPAALLGKMLRIDVSVSDAHPLGYVVPPTNPFTSMSGVLGEIWAFGLRNPWRWSIDMPTFGGTGALVMADVGQGAWEEINYEPQGAGGRNYGWRNREGAHANVTSIAPFSTPLVDPIWEYGRDVGRSITGGFVYRGSAMPSAFRGRYFFGDFATSRIWSLGLEVDGLTREATVTDVQEHTADLGAAATSPSSFGVDAAGELYVVSYGGAVYRIEQTPLPSAGCTSVRPGPDWTCHIGGWLPPGITPPGSTPPPPTPPPPPSSGTCTSVRPGPDWNCHNGGWLPPGITPPGGVTAPPPPPPPAPPPPPPPGTGCSTPQPGADWVCRNGGWLPPNHPGAG